MLALNALSPAGWPSSKAASLFLAELALDRTIGVRQEAAQQLTPARPKRAKRRRPGFQAGIDIEVGIIPAIELIY